MTSEARSSQNLFDAVSDEEKGRDWSGLLQS